MYDYRLIKSVNETPKQQWDKTEQSLHYYKLVQNDDLATLHCRRVIIYGKMIELLKCDDNVKRIVLRMKFNWTVIFALEMLGIIVNGMDYIEKNSICNMLHWQPNHTFC